jgi:hypothetical protein
MDRSRVVMPGCASGSSHPDRSVGSRCGQMGLGSKPRWDVNISGVWSPQEAQEHINVLELRAVLNALDGLQNHLHSKRILLLTDNTSCVAYLKKMGGMRSPALCDLTWEIYRLTQGLQVDLFVRHIPSRLNVLPDALSRRKPLLTEWTLNNSVFQACTGSFHT